MLRRLTSCRLREASSAAQRCRQCLGGQLAPLSTSGEAAAAEASTSGQALADIAGNPAAVAPTPKAPRSSGTGAYKLVNPTLPAPSFLGKRRTPADVLEAIQEVKAKVRCKFDETVELALRLGTDPRRGDQQVRGAVVLPHGTGKAVRVCVFAEGEAAELAKQSGADVVGSDDIIRRVKEGAIEFDKCLATPDMMPRLAAVARILGPRGLMPNPKLGTLVDLRGLPGAISQMKGGRVEYRADRTANLHGGIGKASFPEEHLYANLGSFAAAVLNARPRGVKGSGMSGYILAAHLSSTMGTSVPLALPSLLAAIQKAKN